MLKKKKPYFKHDADASNDQRMVSLRIQHGWKGVGLYWFLIEMLRNSKDYKLPLDYANLCKLAQVRNKFVFPSIIHDFGLFTNLHGMFWSERLLSDMTHMENRSQKARVSVYHRYGKKNEYYMQKVRDILKSSRYEGVRT